MPIITENQLREKLGQPQEGLSVTLPKNTRFSPAAEDFIKQWKISVLFDEGEELSQQDIHSIDAGNDESERKPRWDKPGQFPVVLTGDLPKCSVCGTPVKIKPDYMTQLNAHQYSLKNTPRIRFRGKLDSLHGLVLLVISRAKAEQLPVLAKKLSVLAAYCREIASAEYNQRVVDPFTLDGLSEDEIRKATHEPERVIGISHMVPKEDDPEIIHWLNILRCQIRETEIYALDAFDGTSNDLVGNSITRAINRLSNTVYYLELLFKAGKLT